MTIMLWGQLFCVQTKKQVTNAKLPSDFSEGKVVGCFTIDMPVIGRVYAIDVGRPISETYPYQVVGVPEIHLEAI